MMAINSATKHPQETWEFIKYMRSPEADLSWVTTDFGAIPVTHAAMNYSGEVKCPNLPLFRHELENAVPWPNHPQMIAMISNILAPYCEKAIIGELGVAEALRIAADEMRAIIGETR